MLAILVLAALAITGSAQAGVLAAERLPARNRVGATALAPPETDRAHAAAASCPYQFDSEMPSETFCVYRGNAFGSSGEVCANDAVVIWTSFGSPLQVSAGLAEEEPGSNRVVYLAFVADPELVLQAIVDARRGDRAEVVAYTVGNDETSQPLAGQTTLRAVRLGSSGTADVLSMELREPRRVLHGGCAFASYSGTFIGVLRAPSEAETYADTAIAPRQ